MNQWTERWVEFCTLLREGNAVLHRFSLCSPPKGAKPYMQSRKWQETKKVAVGMYGAPGHDGWLDIYFPVAASNKVV